MHNHILNFKIFDVRNDNLTVSHHLFLVSGVTGEELISGAHHGRLLVPQTPAVIWGSSPPLSPSSPFVSARTPSASLQQPTPVASFKEGVNIEPQTPKSSQGVVMPEDTVSVEPWNDRDRHDTLMHTQLQR